jgi:hypothetical protein
VVTSTIKTATLVAAGHAAAGAISPTVAALKTGVTNAMFMTKIKTGVAVLLAVGLLAGATGVGVLSGRTAAGQDDKKPAAEKPVEPAAKQEKIVTAWGKEVGGLQAGLGFRPGERRAYRHGEEVTLVVRVRNVGREEVKFEYLSPYFKENWPTVTDADGKPVPQPGKAFAGGTAHLPKEVSLPPGKETELADVTYELRPPSDWTTKNSTKNFAPLYGSGKVGIQYERVFGNSLLTKIKIDPNLSKLATGTLELEIKPTPPAATEKK